MAEAEAWTTNIGHPGHANAATDEVFFQFIVPKLFAAGPRGEMSAEAARENGGGASEADLRQVADREVRWANGATGAVAALAAGRGRGGLGLRLGSSPGWGEAAQTERAPGDAAHRPVERLRPRLRRLVRRRLHHAGGRPTHVRPGDRRPLPLTELPTRAASEVAAQRGHDLFQFTASPSAFEDEVIDHREIIEEVEAKLGPMAPSAERGVYNPRPAVLPLLRRLGTATPPVTARTYGQPLGRPTAGSGSSLPPPASSRPESDRHRHERRARVDSSWGCSL